MNQPNYYFAFEIFGCNFNLFVNNIRIIQSLNGKGISFKYPINPFIHNGRNEIELILTKLSNQVSLNERTKCTISIIIEEENNKEQKAIEVYAHKTEEFNVKNPQNKYAHKASFDAKVPFPDPMWKDCLSFQFIPNYHELLYKEYNSLHKILERKDIEAMLRKMSTRQKEMADCIYVLQNSISDNTVENLEINFQNSNWDLQDLNYANLQPTLYAYGKLARLEGSKGESPLKYIDKEKKMITTYDFFFCLNSETKELIIIR
jgi:hypothetical protein